MQLSRREFGKMFGAGTLGTLLFQQRDGYQRARAGDDRAKQGYFDSIAERYFDRNILRYIKYGDHVANISAFADEVGKELGWLKRDVDEMKASDATIDKDAPVLTPIPRSLLGRRVKIPVSVSKSFFENIDNEGDALSILVDHEYVHVKDVYGGIDVGGFLVNYRNAHQFTTSCLTLVSEIRGFDNQFAAQYSGRRRMSQKVHDSSAQSYYEYLGNAKALVQSFFHRVPSQVLDPVSPEEMTLLSKQIWLVHFVPEKTNGKFKITYHR